MKEKAIVDPGRIEEITIVPIRLKLDNFIAIVQIGLMGYKFLLIYVARQLQLVLETL